MSAIVVKEGPLGGTRYEVDRELVLGRGDADVKIGDDELSRRHALLRPVDGGLEIEDLGSLNGTWVNGSRIAGPTRLLPGDTFRLGGTVIEVAGEAGIAPADDAAADYATAPADAAADDEDAVVQARDLIRQYGAGEATVHALRGVSIDIGRGKLTAIMGPSGSGKSTLMHLLAGLDRPTSGSVFIDGTEITKLDDNELTRLRRERIGFIFQFFNLLPMLTVEENILLPLDIAGDTEPHDLERMLQNVGLAERRKHRPPELSGGQQQRVAIARALISRPAVIFADEPTGNLDSETGDEILTLLREAVDEYGQTTVMVTHDQRAAAIADRTLFLADGRIVDDRRRGNAPAVDAAFEDVAAR